MMAASGIALLPVDIVLSAFERNMLRKAPEPIEPIILVCGAPRSGTTLVAEFLINTLQVGYLNNLTSLFPRSPITANILFGRCMRSRLSEYRAFYGKTRGLSGANDALYIWDRWLGYDRSRTPRELSKNEQKDMLHFFGALQQHVKRPIVNKVNRLNTCAHLIAEALAKSTIVYLRRDPLMLAQSLYIARRDILGDLARPYGVAHPNPLPSDPVEDVCRQVEYYEAMSKYQSNKIDSDRLIMLDYEEFCAGPRCLISQIKQRIPDIQEQHNRSTDVGRFFVSGKQRLDNSIFHRFEERLKKLGIAAGVAEY